MRYIEASEKAFTQGAADRLAGSDEKPVMLSSFTYDFGIDTTEVTQKEFFDITGRRPVVDDIYGKGDAYPVYNVSWFDAILFCNAKSKFMGLDTVYEFFQVKLTASGSAYELTGLKIHYEFEGIRLPTEAEWEFVARENTSALPFPHLSNVSEAARMAWFDTTSSGKAHPVAQLEPNAFGIYDLAGNVFEWTGDWKGPYSVPSITNSIGALEPNGYYEKVIKGGAFTHGFINLRPSRRSATYPTTIGTAVRYIGFRCARGAITDVHYIAKGAASVKTNTVDLIAGDMRSLVSSPGARLVFVNVTDNIKTLCVIDYSRSHPLVHEFSDDHNVNVPVISPDGKQVVYSSHGEGFGGNAKGYIRSLDSLDAPPVPIGGDSVYTPRFWADGTFCIYTNSSIDNGTPSWPMTQTIKQKISGGKPSGLPVVLVANGSFHDGLTPDGNYCVTGFTRLIIRDLANGTDRQLFLFPFNGKDSVGSAQVCNVSISPDTVHPPQCMFLDFGSGSKTSTLTGTIYTFLSPNLRAAPSSGTVVRRKKNRGTPPNGRITPAMLLLAVAITLTNRMRYICWILRAAPRRNSSKELSWPIRIFGFPILLPFLRHSHWTVSDTITIRPFLYHSRSLLPSFAISGSGITIWKL
jgi:formylglycine-generating enzyme required for sulfatase activity